MKARSFFLALAAALVVLFSLAAGFWWTMARQSPLRLAEQHLALPRAARFVPRESALSLHWLVDPARLPAYAQAVAPVRHRRDARDSVQQLRDGAFALAGLAFEDELADWIGPQVSLALLEATPDSARMGWVLALSSRDQDGARRFLQRFWHPEPGWHRSPDQSLSRDGGDQWTWSPAGPGPTTSGHGTD